MLAFIVSIYGRILGVDHEVIDREYLIFLNARHPRKTVVKQIYGINRNIESEIKNRDLLDYQSYSIEISEMSKKITISLHI